MIKFQITGGLIEALAVVFTYPGLPDRIIALEGDGQAAFNFSDREAEHSRLWAVSKLICQPEYGDGEEFWCWAKGWYDNGGSKLMKICAGAYGGSIVCLRPVLPSVPMPKRYRHLQVRP